MAERTYTYEQKSRAFYNYLMVQFNGDTRKINDVVEMAEYTILQMLNDYFGTQFGSIYDLSDSNEIEDFRMKIKTHPILKGIDMIHEPRYTEVLKWYRLFIKAQNTDTIPVPVPGEKEQEEEGNTPVPTGNKYLKKNQTTIFTEGEDDGTLTTEHRKRNMELREACIEIFRAKHGGRIVCECCGFDFREAYDIDDEYIEVHHRFPFAQTDGEHPVDAETDLVPLCANCHRMIHHGQGGKGNCMSLDELKQKYRGKTYNNN